MRESDLRKIPDGEILAVLASGLMIIRRKKHEWIPSLDQAHGDELIRLTSPIKGSKFVQQWTLEEYIQRLSFELTRLGWNDATPSQAMTVEMHERVGWSKGVPVTKIRIEVSSRAVHAYPVGN
jgi:hypothetical protein